MGKKLTPHIGRSGGLSRRLGAGLLIGLVIGSGLMYIFYPTTFNRRKGIVRDKALSVLSRSKSIAQKSLRHLRNQFQGKLATIGQSLYTLGAVSDRKLTDRIRSTVGRVVPRPHSVDFAVQDGNVTVRGYLKPHQAGHIIQAIERIPGVISVSNQIIETGEVSPTVQ